MRPPKKKKDLRESKELGRANFRAQNLVPTWVIFLSEILLRFRSLIKASIAALLDGKGGGGGERKKRDVNL